jgi:hypothetical protein
MIERLGIRTRGIGRTTSGTTEAYCTGASSAAVVIDLSIRRALPTMVCCCPANGHRETGRPFGTGPSARNYRRRHEREPLRRFAVASDIDVQNELVDRRYATHDHAPGLAAWPTCLDGSANHGLERPEIDVSTGHARSLAAWSVVVRHPDAIYASHCCAANRFAPFSIVTCCAYSSSGEVDSHFPAGRIATKTDGAGALLLPVGDGPHALRRADADHDTNGGSPPDTHHSAMPRS